MTELSIEELLMKIMWEAQDKKSQAGTDITARRWAVFNTELEKALGYYKAFLESKSKVKDGVE